MGSPWVCKVTPGHITPELPSVNSIGEVGVHVGHHAAEAVAARSGDRTRRELKGGFEGRAGGGWTGGMMRGGGRMWANNIISLAI